MVKNIKDFVSRHDFIEWLKKVLSEKGVKIKKRLSQTFLIDLNELKYIATTIKNEAVNTPCIIEIGAGIGNLSIFLALENSDKVVVSIEIDKQFTDFLKELQDDFPNIDFIIGDAKLILNSIRDCNAVVGNLPYHITSQLLVTIAKGNADIALVTVQKEVAERIISKPGSRNYGKLTVFLQHLFHVKYLKTISLNKFYPKPEVHSAVVILKRKRVYDDFSKLFENVVKCLFSFRRKVISKALTKCLDGNVVEYFNGLKEVWGKRVYQLSVEELEKIVYTLAKQKS